MVADEAERRVVQITATVWQSNIRDASARRYGNQRYWDAFDNKFRIPHFRSCLVHALMFIVGRGKQSRSCLVHAAMFIVNWRGKQSDGKQSDGKQSDGKQSDGKQSDVSPCKVAELQLDVSAILPRASN
jgi:hypothetical protein